MIEPKAHGQAAEAGSPNTGTSGSATRPAPSAISTVVVNGSRPNLMTAFQPAWQAAANSTAAKTKESIQALRGRGDDEGNQGRSGGLATLAAERPAWPIHCVPSALP